MFNESRIKVLEVKVEVLKDGLKEALEIIVDLATTMKTMNDMAVYKEEKNVES